MPSAKRALRGRPRAVCRTIRSAAEAARAHRHGGGRRRARPPHAGRQGEAAGWFARSASATARAGRARRRQLGPPDRRREGADPRRRLGAGRGRRTLGARAGPPRSDSPIGAYAAALARAHARRRRAGRRARREARAARTFPEPVAAALGALARPTGTATRTPSRRVLESFETREAYLEDIPVADTVIVLEALAERRGWPRARGRDLAASCRQVARSSTSTETMVSGLRKRPFTKGQSSLSVAPSCFVSAFA